MNTPNDLDPTIIHNESTSNGDTMTCCLCSTPYQRGDWDFHQLCPTCFVAFDKLKMMGRFGQGAPCESVKGNEQRIRDALAGTN